tara:strand:+ start:14669 stop:15064 length:396 start_codon:yes stop_codon:yes gene_type:complete
MSTIKVEDLAVGSTVEVSMHHNYPLELTMNKNGLLWVVSKNTGGAKAKFTTKIVGRLGANDTTQKEIQVYGGAYAGQGLSMEMRSSGLNYLANATIPWNYVREMWVITQSDIPDISTKYNHLAVIKTAVVF